MLDRSKLSDIDRKWFDFFKDNHERAGGKCLTIAAINGRYFERRLREMHSEISNKSILVDIFKKRGE